MIIKNGQIFTLKDGGSFESLTIETRDDEIIALTDSSSTDNGSKNKTITDEDKTISSGPVNTAPDTIIDATGCYVIPGLIDVHFHGAGGYDFSDGTSEALTAICEYEFKHGITDICPATMTIGEIALEKLFETAVSFIATQQAAGLLPTKVPPAAPPLANLIGIHLEGPFLSPDKKGAQNPDHIINPDPNLIQKWLDQSGNLLKLMTIAPELPGALECIEKFQDKLFFSIGHTNADYNIAKAAMNKGALHITHLFNAMPPLSHRAPGVIGAAADHEDCMVELICDGIHVDPAVIRTTFKTFGENRIILISDSLPATGMPDGTYNLGGQAFTVKDKLALLKTEDTGQNCSGQNSRNNQTQTFTATGTIAGSVCTLYDCMVKAVEFGIPLPSAIKAATINPSRSIGAENEIGSIDLGKKAHFLILDQTDLSIKHIIKGQVYI